jgi:hypothetical protein
MSPRLTRALLFLSVTACASSPPVAPTKKNGCDALEEQELGICKSVATTCETGDVATCAKAARALDGRGERRFPARCHHTIADRFSTATADDVTPILDLLAEGGREPRAVAELGFALTTSPGLVDAIADSGHPAATRALSVAGLYLTRERALHHLAQRADVDAANAAIALDRRALAWRVDSNGLIRRQRGEADVSALPREEGHEPPEDDAGRRAWIAASLASDNWRRVVRAADEILPRSPDAAALAPQLEALRRHWSHVVRSCSTKALGADRGDVRSRCRLFDPEHGLGCHDAAQVGRYRFRDHGVLREVVPRAPEDPGAPLPDVVWGPPSTSNQLGWCVSLRSASAVAPVPGGWLAGFTFGEWGGLLGFVEPSGTASFLASLNVLSIVVTRAGVVLVVTSSDHMGAAFGEVYRLDHSATGWTARRLATLPGAPTWAVLDEDERVLTGSHHGVAAVRVDGTMTPMACE